MPFVSLETGSRLFYTTAGSPSSPAIVFIHGLGSSHNYYYAQLSQLSSAHFCVAFDTPGSAQSPLPRHKLTAASLVADIAALLAHLKVSNAVVVGHSLGGLLATELLLAHPDLVSGLVLLGPVHPSAALAQVFESRVTTVLKSGLEPLYDTVPHAATGKKSTPIQRAFIRELISRQDPAGYIATCEVIATAPVPDFTHAKKVKAVLLSGSEDKAAPFEGCGEIIATGLRAEVIGLDGVGHWHAIEAPDEVTAAVQSVRDSTDA